MTNTLEVTIDINEAGSNLDSEQLESYSHRLLFELDEFSESAYMPRNSQIPEGSKAGGAGFILGLIKAHVSFSNLQKLLDGLGNIFYGKTLEVNYEENGMKVALKYHTGQQLEHQIKAIESLKNLQIKVKDERNS